MKTVSILIICIFCLGILLTGCIGSHNGSSIPPKSGPQTSYTSSISIDAPIHDTATHALYTNMHAAVVSVDGKIVDEFDVALQAVIQEHDTDRDTIRIEVKPLSDFRYTLGFFTNDDYLDNEIVGLPYYCGWTFGMDKKENFSVPAAYALDVDAEYIIIQWIDYQGHYLVASTDPNVSPDTIMDHFAEFLTVIGSQ